MNVKAGQQIKIGGVTIKPKWDWTDEYLSDVRASAGPSTLSSKGQREEDQRKFDQYVTFLASSNGISTEEARALAQQRIDEQRRALKGGK